jgi:hypothetical protein
LCSVFKDTGGGREEERTQEEGRQGGGTSATGTGAEAQWLAPLLLLRHAMEKLKNPTGIFENAPPPPEKKMTFFFGSAAPNPPITQTLLLSENFFIFTLKYF